MQPGTLGTPHRVTREETFVAMQGRAVLEVDGVAYELPAGSAFAVPSGSTVSLTIPGQTGSLPRHSRNRGGGGREIR